jgi:hemerythrin-like metal-binding protein
MAAGGFPGLEAHQSEHAFFVVEAERLQNCVCDIDVDELLTFLRDWLFEHIAKTDRQYLPYIGK